MLSPRTGQKISQTLSPKVHASLYVFSYAFYFFFFSSLSLLSFTPTPFFPPQLASSPGVLSWVLPSLSCGGGELLRRGAPHRSAPGKVCLGRVSADPGPVCGLSAVLPAEQASFTPRRGGRIP